MSLASLSELREYAFIEEKFVRKTFPQKISFNQPKIKLLEYSPDIISLDVQLDDDGIFVAIQNYSPFWKCLVDGINERIESKTLCKRFIEQCKKGVEGYLNLFPNKEVKKITKQWK